MEITNKDEIIFQALFLVVDNDKLLRYGPLKSATPFFDW